MGRCGWQECCFAREFVRAGPAALGGLVNGLGLEPTFSGGPAETFASSCSVPIRRRVGIRLTTSFRWRSNRSHIGFMRAVGKLAQFKAAGDSNLVADRDAWPALYNGCCAVEI